MERLLFVSWALRLILFQGTTQAFVAPPERRVPKLYDGLKSDRKPRIRGKYMFALHSVVPSWSELEDQFGESFHATAPVSIDSVLQPDKPDFSTAHPTLFRERHGWCPYSERVWLALEIMGAPHDTIRIDNTGGPRPSYYGGGTTPQMKWEDGRIQSESMDLVYRLDEENPSLFDLQSSNPEVRQLISKFRSIFPSRSRPSSRAAYLFQYSGDPLWKSTFEDTLQKTDALLSETSSKGPFFLGESLTAADVAWAPFLERYRYQLPCLHPGLDPYDAELYPHLCAWYDAMDRIPAYICRVKGNASSWRKVLLMAGFGNAGSVPSNIQENVMKLIEDEQSTYDFDKEDNSWQEIWDSYAKSRPHMAATPAAQAAMVICSNRDALIKDVQRQQQLGRYEVASELSDSVEILDETLRELVQVLLGDADETSLTNDSRRAVGELASFLNERICIPRDMGALPATALENVEWKLKTFH